MEPDENFSTLKSELKTIIEYHSSILKILAPDPILVNLTDIIHDFLTKIILENNKKITIAVFGMTNSGKSTLLNALIGQDFLDSHVLECTFFGTKIRTSLEQSSKSRFYESSNPEQIFENFEQIREKIKKINTEQRLKNAKETGLWVLETAVKAFSRPKTFKTIKDIYEYIEFIDLPGLDDNELDGRKDLDWKGMDVEARQNYLDVKFSNIFDKVDIDALIILLDYKKQDSIKRLFEYFKLHLFKGKNRIKLQELLNKKKLLIVVNKYEPLEKENLAERKKELETQIFTQFFIPKESKFSEFAKKFFKNDKELKIDSLLKYGPEDFEQKCKEYPHVIFVSSAEAKTIFKNLEEKIEKEKNDLDVMGCFTKEKIDELINEFIEEETKQNPLEYNEKSNFEQFVNVLSGLFIDIGTQKIITPMKKLRDALLCINEILLQHKDNDCDLKQNFHAIQTEISEICQKFQKEVNVQLDFYSEIGEMFLSQENQQPIEIIGLILNLDSTSNYLKNHILKNKECIMSKLANSNIFLITDSILSFDLKSIFLCIDKTFMDIVLQCVLPEDMEPNDILQLLMMLKLIKTEEQKTACSIVFSLKMNDSFKDRRLATFKEIYGNLKTQMKGCTLAFKIKVEKVLEEYKNINEIK